MHNVVIRIVGHVSACLSHHKFYTLPIYTAKTSTLRTVTSLLFSSIQKICLLLVWLWLSLKEFNNWSLRLSSQQPVPAWLMSFNKDPLRRTSRLLQMEVDLGPPKATKCESFRKTRACFMIHDVLWCIVIYLWSACCQNPLCYTIIYNIS